MNTIAPTQCSVQAHCRSMLVRFSEMAEYDGDEGLFSETEEPEDTGSLSPQPATIFQALPAPTDSSDSADAELIGNGTPRRPVSSTVTSYREKGKGRY